jgi:hypothetical protein
MTDDAKTNPIPGWALPAGLVVGVFALWALWLLYGVQFVHARLSSAAAAGASAASSRIAELGQVGDLFGGISALFAALAGAGVFWAGYLQHRTLAATRNARDEEKQRFVAQQLEEEARHKRQQFEATFFQLLALLRDLLQSLRLRQYTPGTISDGGSMQVDWVIDHIVNVAGGLHGYGGGGPPNVAVAWDVVRQRAQEFVFSNNSGQLSPLFRTVYELFDHVGQVERTEPELASKYANIAKAQLTCSSRSTLWWSQRGRTTKSLSAFTYWRLWLSTSTCAPLRYHYSAFDSLVAVPGM